jgi:cytochrome c peroxidase
MSTRSVILRLFCAPSLFLLAATSSAGAPSLTPKQQLGRSIFFDVNLSLGSNQACADCHGPDAGWTGPDSAINAGGAVYAGAVPGRFGSRKPPSSAYATASPLLHFFREPRKDLPTFVGGNFQDGRATGETLGNPAADQAQGPFLNPLEQALPDSACVVRRVCTAQYPHSLADVYSGSCAITFPVDIDTQCAEGQTIRLLPAARTRVEASYQNIALAVAAFEASPESSAYTSKYDAFLAGKVKLSKLERQGLALFKGQGKCAACHVLDAGPGGGPPVLTNFGFDNLGVPRNPQNPFYEQALFNPDGREWIDMGLGGFLEERPDYLAHASENYGKQKVPTLRNVDRRPNAAFVKAYAHNGYFKTLKQVVHFYNTRDARPLCADDPATATIDEAQFVPVEQALARGCWPEPEVPVNVNMTELGDLHLSDAQEDAIVAFMQTLSDGYTPP